MTSLCKRCEGQRSRDGLHWKINTFDCLSKISGGDTKVVLHVRMGACSSGEFSIVRIGKYVGEKYIALFLLYRNLEKETSRTKTGRKKNNKKNKKKNKKKQPELV